MKYVVAAGTHDSSVFDHAKLSRSIAEACLSVRTPSGSADHTAAHVVAHVIAWLENKVEVTSSDIRRKAGEALAIHNPEAAALYEQERLIT